VEASGRPGRQTQSTTCRACSSRRWRASYDLYIRDAEEAGDEELATFFIQVRDKDSMRAEEAQRLLAERTPPTNGEARPRRWQKVRRPVSHRAWNHQAHRRGRRGSCRRSEKVAHRTWSRSAALREQETNRQEGRKRPHCRDRSRGITCPEWSR
jgi:hypothetical protein